MSALASGQDLIDAFDIETIRNLLSSNDQPIPREQVAKHPRMTSRLRAASGRVEAALRAGDRYHPKDLTGLTGNSRDHLVNVVVTIAMADMMRYKPGSYETVRESYAAQGEEYLNQLRKGINVFGLPEHIEAGLLDTTDSSDARIFNRQLKTDRLAGRLFANNED